MAGYAITDAIFSPVARKIPEQEKNHKFCFCGPRQGLWSSSLCCIVVSHVGTGSGWVDCYSQDDKYLGTGKWASAMHRSFQRKALQNSIKQPTLTQIAFVSKALCN